jgi:phage baseplate assembly protein W
MADTDSDESYTSFLGTGWSYPPEFNNTTGEVLMTSDEEDIEASLKILLATAFGERFLQPKYGLNMHETLFEPMSTTTTTFLKERIKLAILIYEPRVNLVSLDLDTSEILEGKVTFGITYEVKSTNSRFNLVYPFYLTDGSEVSP